MNTNAPSSAPDVSPTGQAPILAPVADVIKSMDGIKDNVVNVKDNTMNSVQNILIKATSTNASVMVTFLIIGIAVAVVAGYMLYYMLTRGTVFKNIGYTIPGTKTPVPAFSVMKVNSEGLPSMRDKMSISFWMYVNELPSMSNSTKVQTIVRHVWHNGNEVPLPMMSGPLVSIVSYKPVNGPQQNVLCVSMKPKTTETTTKYTYDPVLRAAYRRGFIFDYIPIKRWVNITVVVNFEANTIIGYMDGQIMSETKPVNVVNNLGITVSPLSKYSNEIDLASSYKDIYIGGAVGSQTGIGFAGLVSNIRFYNYALSTNDVYREYKRGPIDNLLTKMGLPAYGLRQPLYKIGETE